MRKIMTRNIILMAIATIAFTLSLAYYLGFAGSVSGGEATGSSEFVATEKGFASDITVTVTMDGTTLTAVKIDSTGETPDFGGKAGPALEEAILAAGGVDGVDIYAGATVSSNAILKATQVAIAQNTGASAGATGEEFTASEKGLLSDISVTATVADGTLTDLVIDASGETPEYGGKAAETLTAAILAAGGTDGVDTVAGATVSSSAILKATDAALADAGL